jgi:hypothetical protein
VTALPMTIRFSSFPALLPRNVRQRIRPPNVAAALKARASGGDHKRCDDAARVTRKEAPGTAPRAQGAFPENTP